MPFLLTITATDAQFTFKRIFTILLPLGRFAVDPLYRSEAECH